MPSKRRRPRGLDGKVGGHFLESAAARTLDMRFLRRMSEDQAIDLFVGHRWAASGGRPVCPHPGCGGERVYKLTVNRRTKAGIKPVRKFKCAACRRQFSPTSGTLFAHHKLELRDYLYAAAEFVNHVKGEAALAMARGLPCQPKVAFVLAHKLREAIKDKLTSLEPLNGDLEVDGSVYGGVRRKANLVKKRKHSNTVPDERQVVVALRVRNGETRTFTFKHENDAAKTLMANMSKEARLFADEANAWDILHSHARDVQRINHTKYGYWRPEANTNSVESFFSRLRRAQRGIHHRICGRHLGAYATEMAWRETHRRMSNGFQFDQLIRAAATSPPSREWTNYWDYSGKLP